MKKLITWRSTLPKHKIDIFKVYRNEINRKQLVRKIGDIGGNYIDT